MKKAILAIYLWVSSRAALVHLWVGKGFLWQMLYSRGGHNAAGASFKTPFLSREGEGHQTISSQPPSFCNALLPLACNKWGFMFCFWDFFWVTFSPELIKRNAFTLARTDLMAVRHQRKGWGRIINNFPPLTWFILAAVEKTTTLKTVKVNFSSKLFREM